MWLLRVELPDGRHQHIDVADPAIAAVVIDTLSEATGTVIRARLEQYQDEWTCQDCDAWRFELRSSALARAL